MATATEAAKSSGLPHPFNEPIYRLAWAFHTQSFFPGDLMEKIDFDRKTRRRCRRLIRRAIKAAAALPPSTLRRELIEAAAKLAQSLRAPVTRDGGTE